MDLLRDIFSFVCGQEHNWVVGGEELPFCQRCTGMYVGAVPALLAYLVFRPKASSWMLWVHGLLLLAMVPFGYHLVAQTGEIRMLTGQLFAIGLIYYLTLLPTDKWEKWRELSPAALFSYFAVGGLALLLLPAAVIWGGPRTNAILSWTGFIGLLTYGVLVLGNVVLLSEFGWGLLRRRAKHAES